MNRVKVKMYLSAVKPRTSLMVVYEDGDMRKHKASAYLPSWYVRNPTELTYIFNLINDHLGWEAVVKHVQLLDRDNV